MKSNLYPGTGKRIELYICIYVYIYTLAYYRQIDRQVDRQIDRQIDRWMDRQTDRQIRFMNDVYIRSHIYVCLKNRLNCDVDNPND